MAFVFRASPSPAREGERCAGKDLSGCSDGLDFNALDDEALRHLEAGAFDKAREIYLVMGDGDPSLDAGSLAHRIGLTYEAEGRLMEAKYWFNRAVEENRTIEPYKAAAAKYKDYYPASFLKVIPNP